MFSGAPNRHDVVAKFSTMLDKLVDGEDPTYVEPVIEEGEGGEEGEEAAVEGGEASTEARTEETAEAKA